MSVKCAEVSPRICNDGSIRWYEGDTFILEFNLTFRDSSDNVLETTEKDEISIVFNDKYSNVVWETKVIGTNILPIHVDEEVTKLFKVGKYTYCVKRNADFITTLMKNNMVVVE